MKQADSANRREARATLIAAAVAALAAIASAIIQFDASKGQSIDATARDIRKERGDAYFELLNKEQTGRGLVEQLNRRLTFYSSGEPRIHYPGQSNSLLSTSLTIDEYREVRSLVAPIRASIREISAAASRVEIVGPKDSSDRAKQLSAAYGGLEKYLSAVEEDDTQQDVAELNGQVDQIHLSTDQFTATARIAYSEVAPN
ncbi:hypothetical protein [Pseudonocardia phyllosphaerae]|uniref:hypothetical protein n=1 Tax=Pseudonocardia phyllosphaerae TaxID=3390502 RepID=UPI00397D8964